MAANPACSYHDGITFKSGVLQPLANFIKREGVALVRVHQHIDGEDQGWDRHPALCINQNLRDCDRTAGASAPKVFFNKRRLRVSPSL
jgi:hypothetical protein